jgi:hypothetical protein
MSAGGGGEMARDTQTGVFDSCLAALPMQKPKTEQIPAECASADEQCHHAFSTSKRGRIMQGYRLHGQGMSQGSSKSPYST